MALTTIKTLPTFLSEEVLNLLTKVGQESKDSEDAEYFLANDFRIDWKNVEDTLANIPDTYGSKEWFCSAVKSLNPLFNHCGKVLIRLSSEDYEEHLLPYLKWTYQEEVVSDCIKFLHGEYEADQLLAILLITSLAERALGNLLLTRQKQVPFLLRDLLVTPELHGLLGKPKMQVLVILIGSVIGLNLRNIAWHGFMSPKEVKSQFVGSIIFILADCGRTIKDTPGLEACIPQRAQTDFSEAKDLNVIFRNIPKLLKTEVKEIMGKSPLVPDIMLPVWNRIIDLSDEGKYGFSLVLLLPMLECSMRCLFAHVNKASARVLTAENSTFYTTFDEILQLELETTDSKNERDTETQCAEALQDIPTNIQRKGSIESNSVTDMEQASINSVPFAIGKQLNEALHDLLNYVQGPRVRDKLSHGEVQLYNISEHIFNYVFHLSLLFLTLGNWKSKEVKFSSLLKSHLSFESNTENTVAMQTHHTLTEENTNTSQTLHTLTEENTNTSQTPYTLTEENTNISQTRHTLTEENTTQIHNCHISSIISPSDYEGCAHSIVPFPQYSKNIEALIQLLENCIVEYKSVYHPSAILVRNMISCLESLEKWTEWDRVSSDELNYTSWEAAELIELPKQLCFPVPKWYIHDVISFNSIQVFKMCITKINYDVLYRSKTELEVVSLLRRILSSVQLSLDNTSDNLALKFQQYTTKTLRSRQRETYRRQLIAIPTIVLNCYFTCQLVYALFMSRDGLQLDKSHLSTLLKKFKSVLKCHENIACKTSSSVNRWDEAFKYAMDNISDIVKKFGN